MVYTRDPKNCKYLSILPKHEARHVGSISYCVLVIVGRSITISRSVQVGYCRFITIAEMIAVNQLLWLGYYGSITMTWLLQVDCYGFVAIGQMVALGWQLWINCCRLVTMSWSITLRPLLLPILWVIRNDRLSSSDNGLFFINQDSKSISYLHSYLAHLLPKPSLLITLTVSQLRVLRLKQLQQFFYL